MAGIGVTVGELSALGLEHLGAAITHQDTAQRLVTIGHRLGEGHQVGFHFEVVGTEPLAQAAETTDHLVADQ